MKKFFRYSLIVSGILFIVFISLGLIRPEVSYQNSIKVNSSAEEAFEIFMDTSIMEQWINGLKKIELTEGGMNRPGSKWKLYIEENGSTFVMNETLTAYEENRRFAFVLENEVMITDVDIRFTPSHQGTIITADNNVRGRNIFWRSLFFLSASYFRNSGQEVYDRLRDIIEKKQVPA